MVSPVRLPGVLTDYALRQLVHSDWAILGIQPENKKSVLAIQEDQAFTRTLEARPGPNHARMSTWVMLRLQ